MVDSENQPGDDTGTGTAPGAGSTQASSSETAAYAAQAAGPATAVVAGALPNTGAASDLVVLAGLGLAILFLGLGLLTRRREGTDGRLRGQGVAQAL